jgi:protein TonB
MRFDQLQDEPENPRRISLLQVGLLAVAAAVIVLAIVWVRSGTSVAVKKTPPDIFLAKLPPPPPPPPPPPEPPKVDEKPLVATEKPKIAPPKPQQPPAGPPALAAKGQGPADAFGLAGREGGADYGAGGGTVEGWYAGVWQAALLDAINRDSRLKGFKGQVVVHIWLDATGAATGVRIRSSSGNPEYDEALRDIILHGVSVKEALPKQLKPSITLRVRGQAQQG